MHTTTDRAADLRKAYKSKGWTSRDISVRSEYYSMGSSLHVVIKNPVVPLQVVETMANEHESIDRDQWGEILSGGNRYVHVRYSDAALEQRSAPYLPAVLAAAAIVEHEDNINVLIPVEGTAYLVGRGNNGWGFSLWSQGGHIQTANEAKYLAAVIACHA